MAWAWRQASDYFNEAFPTNETETQKVTTCNKFELNSEHDVYVTYVITAELFMVQHANDAQKLKDMMFEINRRTHRNLSQPPMIGTVCLAKTAINNLICRASILSVATLNCELYLIDFGYTEMVSFEEIYDIPEKYVEPNAFTTKFCLSGVRNIQNSFELNQEFTKLVKHTCLKLKVVAPDGPALVQYCELYINNDNVLNILCKSNPSHINQLLMEAKYSQHKDKNEMLLKKRRPKKGLKPVENNFIQTNASLHNYSTRFTEKELHTGNKNEQIRLDKRLVKAMKTLPAPQNVINRKRPDQKFYDARLVHIKRSYQVEPHRESFSKNLHADQVPLDAQNSHALPRKTLADPMPLEIPYTELKLFPGAQWYVAVSWIVSPEIFYIQIIDLRISFLNMMTEISEMYRDVAPYDGPIRVGASILVRRLTDMVFYRATVVSTKPFCKFIVRYVDFGNEELVDASNIWQLDAKFLFLPPIAVRCSLIGATSNDSWKIEPAIDSWFNQPHYMCVFHEYENNHYKVTLWEDGVSVADKITQKQIKGATKTQDPIIFEDVDIHLNTIKGQKLLCRVTHVVSYEEFYVQLDIQKVALIEESIVENKPKIVPLPVRSIAKGMYCTVRCMEHICRAVIMQVYKTKHVLAGLIDYGCFVTVPYCNVMVLPDELAVYYYQTLCCYFNSYTARNKPLYTLEELKTKLIGKKIIIEIKEVKGFTVGTTLYDLVTGCKVAVFESDLATPKTIFPLCQCAVLNTNFGPAFLSHIESVNTAYLQKATDQPTITSFMDELNTFYGKGTHKVLRKVDIYKLCAALAKNGIWYRATIINVREENVYVYLNDYGNYEIVPKSSIRILSPKFYEQSSFALEVSLGLEYKGKVNTVYDKLIELNCKREVQVTLKRIDSREWLADITIDGVGLATLIHQEKTKPVYPELPIQLKRHETKATPKLCIDDKMSDKHQTNENKIDPTELNEIGGHDADIVEDTPAQTNDDESCNVDCLIKLLKITSEELRKFTIPEEDPNPMTKQVTPTEEFGSVDDERELSDVACGIDWEKLKHLQIADEEIELFINEDI